MICFYCKNTMQLKNKPDIFVCNTCNIHAYAFATHIFVKIFDKDKDMVLNWNKLFNLCYVRAKRLNERIILPFSTPTNITKERLEKLILLTDGSDF